MIPARLEEHEVRLGGTPEETFPLQLQELPTDGRDRPPEQPLELALVEAPVGVQEEKGEKLAPHL